MHTPVPVCQGRCGKSAAVRSLPCRSSFCLYMRMIPALVVGNHQLFICFFRCGNHFSRVIGTDCHRFSHRTCLPAASARTARSQCERVGVQITAASIQDLRGLIQSVESLPAKLGCFLSRPPRRPVKNPYNTASGFCLRAGM